MDFDDLLKKIIPSEESILEQVDEYTLYCFYIGIDPTVLSNAYNAPYRADRVPSFSIFRTNRSTNGIEYLWKDHTTGEAGNIFKLIQKIEQLSTKQEVYARINEDFGLDYELDPLKPKNKIVYNIPPESSNIKIRIANVPLTEAGLKFWKQFDVKKEGLDKYFTTQLKWYWSYEGQQCPTSVMDPTFAYEIGGYYQIYSPYAPRQYKFRNDYPEDYFFGYMQLPRNGDKLVIDKSSKDVIFCDSLGYCAVCGKSETTQIPEHKILELKERFKRIVLMLDNDEAGINMSNKYKARYDFMEVKYLTGSKDKTDLCKLVGPTCAKKIIDNLLA